MLPCVCAIAREANINATARLTALLTNAFCIPYLSSRISYNFNFGLRRRVYTFRPTGSQGTAQTSRVPNGSLLPAHNLSRAKCSQR
jgi:hypothetical protein